MENPDWAPRARLAMSNSAADHERTCPSCQAPMNVGVVFPIGNIGAREPICVLCILDAVRMLTTWDNWSADTCDKWRTARAQYQRARVDGPHWEELSPERQAQLVREPAGNAEPEANFRIIKSMDYWHVIRANGLKSLCDSAIPRPGNASGSNGIDGHVMLSFAPGAEPFCATCRSIYLELRRIPIRYGT